MKKVTLVRHAKSSWKDASLPDIKRPLNKRGKNDAKEMGKHLKKVDLYPDIVYCSPAKRARHTAEILLKELLDENEIIRLHEEIYFSGSSEIISLVKSTKDQYNSVFLFGHMPDMASVLGDLSGVVKYEFPTCCVASITFDVNHWTDIKEGEGENNYFVYPKMMPWHNLA